MSAKKLPWRTLVTSEGPAGRFTREQIRNAVIAAELARSTQKPQRTRKRVQGAATPPQR